MRKELFQQLSNEGEGIASKLMSVLYGFIIPDHLLCKTTCCVRPPVVQDHLLCKTTCCVRPPVVQDHLLCKTTCCAGPPVILTLLQCKCSHMLSIPHFFNTLYCGLYSWHNIRCRYGTTMDMYLCSAGKG